jgi:hypothetical protein
MKIGRESPRYELVVVPPGDSQASRAAPAGTSGPSFAAALEGIGSAVDRGEALIARAAHGHLGSLDSAQLIALQAGIYRYSEAVDLVAKLVDRASSAVKTVISPHS